MKRRLNYLVLTAGLSAILGSSSLTAQSQKEVADIPFAFHANNTTLPAGTYTVSKDTATGVFRLSNPAGHSIFVAAQMRDTAKVENPKLIFSCYGQECLLSQIWTPDGTEYGVPSSGSDKELTRKMGLAANLRSVRLASR